MEITREPVILIHGMFGWGRKSPLWNMFPNYWPENELYQINPNHIIVEVGVGSSDHDRACEVFYQLMGGTVDYGEAHSKKMGHTRFGLTYKGSHTRWNKNNPVHLIGHSMGGTTAIELYQLIAEDAFNVGSDSSWIKSIVTIASPLSGTILGHTLGLSYDYKVIPYSFGHILGIVLGILFRYQINFPILKGLYDLRMYQWKNHLQWHRILSIDHPYNTSMDNVFHNIIPGRRVKRNSELKHMDKVYLISIVCKAQERIPWIEMSSLTIMGLLLICFYTKPFNAKRKFSFLLKFNWLFLIHQKLNNFSWKTKISMLSFILWFFYRRIRHLDFAHTPILWSLVWLTRQQTKHLPKLYDGYEKEMWYHNDGIVNTYSMLYPRYPKQKLNKIPSQTSLLLDSIGVDTHSDSSLTRIASHQSIDNWDEHYERNVSKGRWYIHRVERNHFCGTNGDAGAKQLYQYLFRMMNHLP